MTQPTFAIAVTFQVKPENTEQFVARVLQQAKDSVEKEPGCCQFDVLQDEADPNTVFLYETYVDPEAFVDHRGTSHFADFDSTVAEWVASKTIVRLKTLATNLSAE